MKLKCQKAATLNLNFRFADLPLVDSFSFYAATFEIISAACSFHG